MYSVNMSKKLKILLSIIFILFNLMVGFILFSLLNIFIFSQIPHRITQSWQTVNISEFGTFRVPAEWNVEEHDGILYITDRQMSDGNYTIYIVGRRGIRPYEIFEGVERGRVISSRWFFSAATLLLNEYAVNGEIQEHRLLEIQSIQSGTPFFYYSLFMWDSEVVDRWHAEQIARTFSRTREGFDDRN